MADMEEAVRVFSYAVALEQSGKMKNVICCKDKMIYILNFDKTCLLKFELSRDSFESSIAFNTDDYDSKNFTEQDGKIIFLTEGKGNYDREKICKSPSLNFEEADQLFKKFWGYSGDFSAVITFNENDLGLLEEQLSHVEFLSQGLSPVVLQRDIFTGSLIKLKKKGFKGLSKVDNDEILEDFGPVGVRTNDFIALFTLNPVVDLFFLPPKYGYIMVEGKNYKMKAILAKCLYDDLGRIETLEEGGDYHRREKQEDRNTKQEASGTADEDTQSQDPVRRRRRGATS